MVVQNFFDWRACEEEQERFDQKTMISVWFVGRESKEER